MMGLVIGFHVIVCILLMIIILMQSGRGGGLTEGFAKAESIFGTQTNVVMVRATSIFGGFFLVTCLSLAIISSNKERSLMERKSIVEKTMNLPTIPLSATTPIKADKAPQTENKISEPVSAPAVEKRSITVDAPVNPVSDTAAPAVNP